MMQRLNESLGSKGRVISFKYQGFHYPLSNHWKKWKKSWHLSDCLKIKSLALFKNMHLGAAEKDSDFFFLFWMFTNLPPVSAAKELWTAHQKDGTKHNSINHLLQVSARGSSSPNIPHFQKLERSEVLKRFSDMIKKVFNVFQLREFVFFSPKARTACKALVDVLSCGGWWDGHQTFHWLLFQPQLILVVHLKALNEASFLFLQKEALYHNICEKFQSSYTLYIMSCLNVDVFKRNAFLAINWNADINLEIGVFYPGSF